MTHAIPFAIVLIYVAVLFVVSWWSNRVMTRGTTGTLGYLLAGRKMPAWVGAALLAGLAVGGVSTIGVAEQAYTSGISAGWYNAAWAIGAFVVGLGVARPFRRFEITTLPELFERHYGATSRVVGVAGQLVIQVVITSLQYVAGGAILASLMPGVFTFRVGMLVTAVVFVGITLFGGFWAAGLTNVVNVVVIYVGVILGAALTVGKVGGLGGLSVRLPTGHPGFDLFGIGPAVIAAWIIVMVTQAHSTQAVIQIGFAARDDRSAAWGYLLGGAIILPVGFICALIGMASAVLHPGLNPAEALPRVVMDLPPFAAGLVLAGLWAADVSTASALLIGSATLVTNDIVKRFLAPDLSPGRGQALCRITVAVLSVFTFLLALTVEGILKALLIGLTLATAYTLMVVMTILWPAACRRSSATATLLATGASLLAWLVVPPSWRVLPHPIYLTWIVSVLTFGVVALLDRRRIVV